jgi:hypothetical protein
MAHLRLIGHAKAAPANPQCAFANGREQIGASIEGKAHKRYRVRLGILLSQGRDGSDVAIREVILWGNPETSREHVDFSHPNRPDTCLQYEFFRLVSIYEECLAFQNNEFNGHIPAFLKGDRPKLPGLCTNAS